MKTWTQILIFLLGYYAFGQDSMPDWKMVDKSTILKDYIEGSVYHYLDFNPKTADSIWKETISHDGVDTKVVMRNKTEFKRPLVIINDFPLDQWEILELIILEDVKEISVSKSSQKILSQFGYNATYGIIKISMDPRKWKKIK